MTCDSITTIRSRQNSHIYSHPASDPSLRLLAFRLKGCHVYGFSVQICTKSTCGARPDAHFQLVCPYFYVRIHVTCTGTAHPAPQTHLGPQTQALLRHRQSALQSPDRLSTTYGYATRATVQSARNPFECAARAAPILRLGPDHSRTSRALHPRTSLQILLVALARDDPLGVEDVNEIFVDRDLSPARGRRWSCM